MRKTIAIILGMIMLFSFAACGKSAPPEEPMPDEAPETDGAAEDSSKLTVWCWDPAVNIYAMQEAAKIYKARNPGFGIDIVEVPWDELQTRLIAAATAKKLDTLPDIFLCQDDAFQKNIINFPEIFADITNSGIRFNDFGAAKVAYSVLSGRNYGVPFDAGTVIMALRKDVLSVAGYTIDDFTDMSWEQFVDYGRNVYYATGVPLYSDRYRETDLIMIMLQSAGVSLFNADGTPNIADNEVLARCMEVYIELIDSGVCMLVNNWDEYIASFVDGTVGGTINGCRIIGSIQTAGDQTTNWAVTNIPSLDVPGGTNYSNNGGSSWAVASSSGNKELAIDFLANTFAGSVEFYETILESSGIIGTWRPAGASSVYSKPQIFFDGQSVFADIVDFTGKVPGIAKGAYYYEARDAIGLALALVVEGADIHQALQEAEDTVLLQMR